MVEVFPKAADLSEFAFQDLHGRKQTDSPLTSQECASTHQINVIPIYRKISEVKDRLRANKVTF